LYAFLHKNQLAQLERVCIFSVTVLSHNVKAQYLQTYVTEILMKNEESPNITNTVFLPTFNQFFGEL